LGVLIFFKTAFVAAWRASVRPLR